MAYSYSWDVTLAENDEGLTLQWELIDTTGTTQAGPSTSGVVEDSNGEYTVTVTDIPDDFAGRILIRNDATGELLGKGVINPQQGGRMDVAISSRSSHAAADIWSAGTRTLTSFGTLVSDIWSAGTRTLTGFGTLASDVWAVATRTVTGGSVDDLAGQTLADLNDISADDVANAIAGTGENAATLTLVDGNGDPIPSIRCVVRNSDESAIVVWGTTDENGEAAFNLDDGSYKVRYGPSASNAFTNPYDLTVSGGTTETYTGSSLDVSPPTTPELCVCYADIREAVGGSLVGTNAGSVTIIELVSPEWPETSDDAVLAAEQETYYTDADGRVQFEAVRGAELTVEIDRPGTLDRKLTFTVPDEDSYYIPLAGSS